MRLKWLLAVLLFLPRICAGQAFPPLPALNIDINETSISGLSSGAFMAAQFEVAHSSIIKGAGILAGGPYYCAQDDVVRAISLCTCYLDPAHSVCFVSATSAEVPTLEQRTRSFFADRRIDDPRNLANHRVYVLSGGKDRLVPSPIAQQLADYYRRFSVAALQSVSKPGLSHTMPTTDFGTACDVSRTPYIAKCGFDAAHDVLAYVYGALQPKQNGKLGGRFIEFDQAPYVHRGAFLWAVGMDRSGWLYVPKACANGERCRLHVALHGCKQGQSYLPLDQPSSAGLYYGTKFVRHAGYVQWADTNHIAVLFPQAVSIPNLNPNGCWDWWGYTGDDYATKGGVQIEAIRAMIDQLASGIRR
jgi:poly(3-hydroxybutyrate) depolymerase